MLWFRRKSSRRPPVAAAENRQVKLASRPVGMVRREKFNFESAPIPQAGDCELLVAVLYLSLDPAMRAWMNEGKSYVPPVQLGQVMRAGGLGRVVESRAPGFNAGDHVVGLTGVQEYAVLKADQVTRADPNFAPLPAWLGVLGMTGM